MAIVLLTGGFVVVSGSEPALACTCQGGRTTAQKINDSEVAFVGVGVSNDEQKGNATFRVVKAVKGVDKDDLVEIASDDPVPASADGAQAVPTFGGGDCRRVLPLEGEVAVTASRAPDGRLTASECDVVSLSEMSDYARARDRLPLIVVFAGLGIALLFFAARRTKARRERGA